MRTGQPCGDESGIAGALPSAGATDPCGCYVYGIVPSATPLAAGTFGVRGSRGREPVNLVPYGDIAALVSGSGPALTQPENLVAHKRLLDELAAAVPILPLRFGTVLADRQAVTDLLLVPGHETFCAALARLEGCAQYLVNGRYAEETVLREVLAENPEAAKLRDDVNAFADADATYGLRIRLGRIVSTAIEAKRMADTRALCDAVAPSCIATTAREPTHAHDAVNLALLASIRRQADIEQMMSKAAREWAGRVRLHLVGPMAPYDFAQTALAGG
jgi:hypothetical protein